MYIFNTKTHAALDYIVGVLLIASPWIFGFHNGQEEQWIPIMNGIAVLIISAFTNYEGGYLRNISMRTHLMTDILLGAILAASPWIAGFGEETYLPHTVIGLFEVFAGLTTDRHPFKLGKTMILKTEHRN
ncbi:MAG TPA: SPW repeat protein [Chitinophaga sp.]|nr:SPW repeat protein [Chitinophaga sp.]